MDLNRIGFAVGILLAVPLAIIANLLTPRVREWYGTTSYARTKKRLALLQKKLEEAKKEWLFTPAEWVAYHSEIVTGLIMMLGMLCIFSSILIGLLDFRTELLRIVSFKLFAKLFVAPAMGYLAVVFFFVVRSRRFEKHFQMHSEKGRKRMEEEIVRLNALKENWESKSK